MKSEMLKEKTGSKVKLHHLAALYQTMMRCNARDFDSDKPVTVYVFSKEQAEYLSQRTGATHERIPDVVTDKVKKPAMTSSERSRKARAAKKAAK